MIKLKKSIRNEKKEERFMAKYVYKMRRGGGELKMKY